MSDRRLGHDLDLGDAGGTMTVGCSDAVAARITATDYQDFLAFAIDDVFRGDGDAFEEAVLLTQQFKGEMNAFQVTAFDREVARYFEPMAMQTASKSLTISRAVTSLPTIVFTRNLIPSFSIRRIRRSMMFFPSLKLVCRNGAGHPVIHLFSKTVTS